MYNLFTLCLKSVCKMSIQINFIHKDDIFKYVLDNNKEYSCRCFIYMCLYQ